MVRGKYDRSLARKMLQAGHFVFHKRQEQKTGKGDSPIQPKVGDLIVAEEKRLEIFVGMRFPRLRKISRPGPKVYGGTYNEGVATGKTITFAEGLTAEGPRFGGLLPG